MEKEKKTSAMLILCVFGFALFPLFAVYAHNVEQLTISQLFLPSLFSILIGLLVYFMFRMILKNAIKACLGSTLFLIVFWNYSLLYHSFQSMLPFGSGFFLVVLLIGFALLVYAVGRIQKPEVLRNILTVAFVPVWLLIAFNTYIIVLGELDKARVKRTAAVHETQTIDHVGEHPDIYILIFDEFASPETMETIWGYDHSAFSEKLEDLGFYFANNSKTRYPYTHLSIPGIMNLNYPDPKASRTENLVLYNNNLTFRDLHELGYAIYFLDGWGGFEYTFNIPVTEFVCFYNTSYEPQFVVDEFAYLLLQQSLLTFFAGKLVSKNANHYYLGHKHFLRYIEAFPNRTNASEQPKLLYAHVMAPHLPYVFDRHGNFNVNPTNYWEYTNLEPEVLRKLYFEQYLFISEQITEIVTNILTNSSTPPVILLFSDHGPRLQSAGVADQDQHHRVLNAVFFPEEQYHALYDSISPVNTMRVLFNRYFDADYEMLDEYSFQ